MLKRNFILVLMFCIPHLTQGQSLEYTYDPAGRLIKATYPDSTTIQYCYDELGNRLCLEITTNQLLVSDLLIHNLTTSSFDLCQSAGFSVAYNLENIGIGDAGGFYIKYFLSIDSLLDQNIDDILATDFVESLESGSQQSINKALSLQPSVMSGSYYVIVMVDANDGIAEISDLNNTVYKLITVNGNIGFDYYISAIPSSCYQNNGSIDIFNITGLPPYSFNWSHDPNLNSNQATNLSPASYLVTITDANGCQETTQTEVFNNGAEPSPSFSQTIDGDTVIFINTSQAADSFYWDFGDGEYSNEINPDHVYTSDVEYNICLIAYASCGSNEFCRTIDMSGTASAGYCPVIEYPYSIENFQKSYELLLNQTSYFDCAVLLPNNSILITGQVTEVENGIIRSDLFTSILDLEGNEIHTTILDIEDYEQVSQLKVDTSSGRIYFSGRIRPSNSNIYGGWYGEFNYCGEIVWSKELFGGLDERLHDLEFDYHAERIIFIGQSQSQSLGSSDVLLVETDFNGVIDSIRQFGTANFETGTTINRVDNRDDGIKWVIGGYVRDIPDVPFNTDNLLLILLDSSFIIKGTYSYTGYISAPPPLYGDLKAVSSFIKNNGNIVLAASARNFDDLLTFPIYEPYNSLITELDFNGNIVHSTLYVERGLRKVVAANDSHIVAANQTGLIVFDESLNIERNIDYDGLIEDFKMDLIKSDSNFFFIGQHKIVKTDVALNVECNIDTVPSYSANVSSFFQRYNVQNQFNQENITGLIPVYQPGFTARSNGLAEYAFCPFVNCDLNVVIQNKKQRICLGENFVFNCKDSLAFSVDWYVNGHHAAEGLNCQIDFDTATNFFIECVSSNGICFSNDTLTVIVDPTNDSISISGIITNPGNYFAQDGSIDIMVQNVTGLIDFNWSSGMTTEDLDSIPSGVYAISVTYNNSCVAIKQFEVTDEPDISTDSFPIFGLKLENYSAFPMTNSFVHSLDSSTYYVIGYNINSSYTQLFKMNHFGTVLNYKRVLLDGDVREFVVIGEFIYLLNANHIYKIDKDFNIIWGNNYTTDDPLEKMKFTDIVQADSNEIVITGFLEAQDVDGNDDEDFIFTAKIDSNGVIIWHRVIGYNGGDSRSYKARYHNGNIYVAGYTPIGGAYENIFVLKYDNNGLLDRFIIFDGHRDELYDLEIADDGTLLILFEENQTDNAYIFKSASDGYPIYWIGQVDGRSPHHDYRSFDILKYGNDMVVSGIFKHDTTGVWKESFLRLDIGMGDPIDFVQLFNSGGSSIDSRMIFDSQNNILSANGSYITKFNFWDTSLCYFEEVASLYDDISGSGFIDVTYYTEYNNTYTINILVDQVNKIATNGSFDLTNRCGCNEISDFSFDSLICTNFPITFSALDTAMNNYYWMVDNILIQSMNSNFTHSFENNGEYEIGLMVRNKACFDTTYHTVQVGNPNISFDLGPDASICGQYHIQPNITNLPVLWSTGDSSSSLIVTQTGIYYATLTDLNGCTYTDSVHVIILPSLDVNFDKLDNTCESNGSIIFDVSNGNEPYFFSWSNGETQKNMYNLEGGLYTVTITDFGICSDTLDITVMDLDTDVDFVVNDVACYEQNGQLEIQIVNGIPPYTYLWSTGDTSLIISNLSPTSYFVNIIDSTGCEIIRSVNLGLDHLLVQLDTVVCPGSTVRIQVADTVGTMPSDFTWSNGEDGYAITVAPIHSTTYHVIYQDSFVTCQDEFNLVVDAGFNIATEIVKPFCFGDSNGQISIVVDTLAGNYSLNWSDGSTGSQNLEVSSGLYHVTVSVANGCSAITSIYVDEPNEINLQVVQDHISAVDSSDGEAIVIVIGGTSPYSFEWSHSTDTAGIVSGLPMGLYSVTVSDQNGCTKSSSFSIGFAGCMDSLAHNFIPGANIDDGSCETCTDNVQNGDEIGIDCGGNFCDLCTILGLDCPHTLDLAPTSIMSGRYKADQLIMSNNLISGANEVLYESGNTIELQELFEVELGVEFEAKIKDCVPE